MFKSTASLFSKIKEDFKSFDNSSLIDEGRFFKDVKYILNLLGRKWYITAETILEVCDYKVELPDDFYLVESLYKCNSTIETDCLQPGVVLRKLTFDHYPNPCDRDPHHFDCEAVPYNDCIFNRQEEILVQRDNIVTRYSHPVLMKTGNVSTRECCTNTCANIYSKCLDTFSIQNGKLYTNFKEGSMYLMYNAFPLDEEGYPLIPDNEMVEKCIEYYIKSNILENIWINGDADVERKFIYFKQEYDKHRLQAIYESKLPSFENMVKQIRLKRKSLDIYQII